MNKKELGIYIHIPFCKDKCYYCDFISFKNMEEKADEYVECIVKEIENQNWDNLNNEYEVTTIYIGGGTPSYIDSKNIVKIIELLKSKINKKNLKNADSRLNNNNKKSEKNTKNNEKELEITIEVNPGTVDEEKLLEYKRAGINRLSIGLQSTNNILLKQIGRIHTYEQFLKTYDIAQKIGFENINVDLMLGLPNQIISDLKESVEKIIELNPNHISVYSLILEEETPLFTLVKDGKLELPDEETERQMYWYVKDKLELCGYIHYEISNFAKKGKEAKHNMNCWNQEEYLGFGLSAHSYLKNKRFSNTINIKEYIKNVQNNEFNKNVEMHEIQTIDEKEKEYILLGLRKIEGISISKFKEKFIGNPIYIFRNELEKLTNQELIYIDGDSIKLTAKGLDFANLVWEEFV